METFKGADLAGRKDFFEVLATTERTQFASMYLQPGQTSGEFGTNHPQADQYVVVLDGTGTARSGEGEIEIHLGDVVLIPAGDKHQFTGGAGGLKTITFYGPVAYPDEA